MAHGSFAHVRIGAPPCAWVARCCYFRSREYPDATQSKAIPQRSPQMGPPAIKRRAMSFRPEQSLYP